MAKKRFLLWYFTQRYSHDDEHCADDDALYAPAENRVRDDGKRLIDDHIREKKRDEEQVSILTDRLDLVRVFTLQTARPEVG